jgi:ATP-dependent DNA ligase
MIIIRTANTTQDLEACFRIRDEVFVVEQKVPVDLERDEHDPCCFRMFPGALEQRSRNESDPEHLNDLFLLVGVCGVAFQRKKAAAIGVKAPFPGFIAPALATSTEKVPFGERRIHEITFDGYRIQVHINRGRKKVFTRNGLDWTKRFTTIAGALDLPGEAIIDGEVVVTHEGRTNFSELQAELAAGRQDRLVYYAFDLLWRNGNLRGLPQIERKQALVDLLGENDIDLPILYSEHLTGDGPGNV